MSAALKTPEDYIAQLPEDRKKVIEALRQVILTNLPKGFEERISYGMIGYVVPHATYPKGYHVDPKLPLPFLNIASQKNYISLYHSGVYADDEVLKWFKTNYPKHVKTKLNMGKSCIRFNPNKALPLELIGALCRKISVEQWIAMYEGKLK